MNKINAVAFRDRIYFYFENEIECETIEAILTENEIEYSYAERHIFVEGVNTVCDAIYSLSLHFKLIIE